MTSTVFIKILVCSAAALVCTVLWGVEWIVQSNLYFTSRFQFSCTRINVLLSSCDHHCATLAGGILMYNSELVHWMGIYKCLYQGI